MSNHKWTDEDKHNPDINLHIQIVENLASKIYNKCNKEYNFNFSKEDIYAEVLYRVFLRLRKYDKTKGTVANWILSTSIEPDVFNSLCKQRSEFFFKKRKTHIKKAQVDLEFFEKIIQGEGYSQEEQMENLDTLEDEVSNFSKHSYFIARCKISGIPIAKAIDLFGSSRQAIYAQHKKMKKRFCHE